MDNDSISYNIERVVNPVRGKALEGGPFPPFKCPRHYYLPIGAWPRDLIYDALPGGGNWYTHFFDALARSRGREVTHEEILENEQAYADATNLIFFACDSLYAATVNGYQVDSEGNVCSERIPIIILGLPNKPPRDDQIELVLELLQMKKEDLIKIRLP